MFFFTQKTLLATPVAFFLFALCACGPVDDESNEAVGLATEIEPDTTSVAELILSGTRMENEPESRLSVNISYPQLNPSARPELAQIFDQVNADIVTRIGAEVDSFLVWAREAAQTSPSTLGGESTFEGGFSGTFVNDRIFSARQHIYTYTLGAAHPNTTSIALNYDLGTGEIVELDHLFDAASSYLDTLSTAVEAGLLSEAEARGLSTTELWEEGYNPTADNFQRFTLGPDSLAIHFPPYAVAPYVAGEFEVHIPYSRLAPILRSNGPARSLSVE